MKRLYKIAMAVAFATILGVGAKAQELVLDFTDNTKWNFPTSAVTTQQSYTANENSVVIEGMHFCGRNETTQTDYLVIGREETILKLPTVNFAVGSIEVVGRSNASTTVEENIYINASYGVEGTAVSTVKTGSRETNVFEIGSFYQTVGTVYTLRILNKQNAMISKIIIKGVSNSTSLDKVERDGGEESIYNLAGQRQPKMQKGILIINGSLVNKR